jgi:putative ABC transport system ATP-binding protein
LIRIDNVHRTFDKGRVPALRGVSFTIAQGEFVAVMGPSGSGKSCLLQILGALDQPDQGEVFFRNQSLRALADPARFRANTIGFIFQSFHLLPTLTALENVQIPMFGTALPPNQRSVRARELLEAVGLGERLDHLPGELSGGERQRVSIARSLANKPELLLADEPTGNLDSMNAIRIMELLQVIHREQGMTLIVVTHDPEVASRAGRVLGLRDGCVVSDTTRSAA